MSNRDSHQSPFEREADRFEGRPILTSLKWLAGVVVLFVAIWLVGMVLGFFGGWLNAGKDIISADNKKAQNAALYNAYAGMEAAAANACAAEKGAGNAESMVLEDPAFAYAAQYRKITIDYNARYADIFKAGLVGPRDLPKRAPTLEAMQDRVCP